MPGQHQVEHDEVGGAVPGERQRREPVLRLEDLETRPGQVAAHDLAQGEVVVDDEHGGHGSSLGSGPGPGARNSLRSDDGGPGRPRAGSDPRGPRQTGRRRVERTPKVRETTSRLAPSMCSRTRSSGSWVKYCT